MQEKFTLQNGCMFNLFFLGELLRTRSYVVSSGYVQCGLEVKSQLQRLRLFHFPLSSCGHSSSHGLMTEHWSSTHTILSRLQVALELAAQKSCLGSRKEKKIVSLNLQTCLTIFLECFYFYHGKQTLISLVLY